MQVPILPIAHNAGWVWPKGVMGKRPGTITMSIGKPIAPNGMNPSEFMQVVENWIEDEVARLGPATGERAEASPIACPPTA
jgi:1-acyl-sn-glycerol-3-phosphate acyltransferase